MIRDLKFLMDSLGFSRCTGHDIPGLTSESRLLPSSRLRTDESVQMRKSNTNNICKLAQNIRLERKFMKEQKPRYL